MGERRAGEAASGAEGRQVFLDERCVLRRSQPSNHAMMLHPDEEGRSTTGADVGHRSPCSAGVEIEATVQDGAHEAEQSGVGERREIAVGDPIGAVDVLGGEEQHLVGDARCGSRPCSHPCSLTSRIAAIRTNVDQARNIIAYAMV